MYKANMTERRLGVKDFSYTDDLLDELEASLSRERLGTYLDAARGDREGAIRLHAWNTAVSAAFYGPLQGLEVTLRNAMYRGLAEHYGEAWYDNRDAGLERSAMERIASARTELARDGHGDDPPRIVAALSFRFWVSLLGPGGRIGAGRKANYEMTKPSTCTNSQTASKPNGSSPNGWSSTIPKSLTPPWPTPPRPRPTKKEC